ncbi:MAG: hypothetical protein RLZ97_1144 [Verrucomicrobiota bacterium]
MKATLFLLLSLAAHGADMTLRFINEDSLPGSLAAIDENGIQWNSPSLIDSPPFLLSAIDSIVNPLAPDPTLPEGDHLAVVLLTNGDTFDGTLIKVTSSEIVLDTGYAGQLTFRRDMVESLDIKDRPEIYYSGPKSLEEWSPGEDETWTFENGELITTGGGSIRKEIGKHTRMHVSFDVTWSEAARLRLHLHSDSGDPDENSSRYELVFQSQYAYMRKSISNGNRQQSSTIGTTGGIQSFPDGERVRVEIFQDLESGAVRLIVAGVVVADWRDTDPSPDGMGPYLHFFCDGSAPTRFSRIRIASWSGLLDGENTMQPGIQGLMFENPEESPAAPPEEEKKGIRLRNGDHIDSEELVIENGEVSLKTRFKDIKLPVSRLRSFALRSIEDSRNPELCWKPIRRAGDIRVWLGNGNRMTLELVSFKDGKLIGRSQTFGEASFDSSVMTRMEFNIYSHPYESGE